MAENIENNDCSQRDSAEHEGYAKASRSFNRIWKERDSAQPRLLEAILYKDNFNRAYKRVKANKEMCIRDRVQSVWFKNIYPVTKKKRSCKNGN